jgi:hypothetical protein
MVVECRLVRPLPPSLRPFCPTRQARCTETVPTRAGGLQAKAAFGKSTAEHR